MAADKQTAHSEAHAEHRSRDGASITGKRP